MAETRCPDCGAGLRSDGFNRHGWWASACGRRYHKERQEWEPWSSTTCLGRQLASEKADNARLRGLITEYVAAKIDHYVPDARDDFDAVRDKAFRMGRAIKALEAEAAKGAKP